MAVKPKVKSKSSKKVQVRGARRSKKAGVKPKSNKKQSAKQKRHIKSKQIPRFATKVAAKLPRAERSLPGSLERTSAKPSSLFRPLATVVKRVVNPLIERRPVMPRTPRIHQFAYMKAPGLEHAFEVGHTVEVYCDHEKSRERIRGWVRGIVVQVDNKMVAVQFRSNVFLTDGWMVPDRILWYPVNSEHIRPVPGKKTVKKDVIPDY